MKKILQPSSTVSYVNSNTVCSIYIRFSSEQRLLSSQHSKLDEEQVHCYSSTVMEEAVARACLKSLYCIIIMQKILQGAQTWQKVHIVIQVWLDVITF